MSSAPSSPITLTAQPQIDAVDTNLQAQIKTLTTQAAAQQTALLSGNQAIWLMPVLNDWTGDLFDFTGMASPFDRSETNDAFTEAISDATNPGTTGDLAVASLTVDYLAVMERSFRCRHTMKRVRAVCHAMGRKAGHGSASGSLNQCVIQYLNGLIAESNGGGAQG